MHLKFSGDGNYLLSSGYETVDKYLIYAFKKQDGKYFKNPPKM